MSRVYEALTEIEQQQIYDDAREPWSTRILRYRQQLRENMTPQEVVVWGKIKPIQYMGSQIIIDNRYIADFCHMPTKNIFELDGKQHTQFGFSNDCVRDTYLTNHGYTVTRFENHEVDSNLDRVVSIITDQCMNALKK